MLTLSRSSIPPTQDQLPQSNLHRWLHSVSTTGWDSVKSRGLQRLPRSILPPPIVSPIILQSPQGRPDFRRRRLHFPAPRGPEGRRTRLRRVGHVSDLVPSASLYFALRAQDVAGAPGQVLGRLDLLARRERYALSRLDVAARRCGRAAVVCWREQARRACSGGREDGPEGTARICAHP